MTSAAGSNSQLVTTWRLQLSPVGYWCRCSESWTVISRTKHTHDTLHSLRFWSLLWSVDQISHRCAGLDAVSQIKAPSQKVSKKSSPGRRFCFAGLVGAFLCDRLIFHLGQKHLLAASATRWLPSSPHRRGRGPVQKQQFLNESKHRRLLSFSDADVCLLCLNTTTSHPPYINLIVLNSHLYSQVHAQEKCWRKKSQVNDCFCPWYFFTTSLDDPLITYYHPDSCWETNRTDLKDLFPSPPVQRLPTCLANYDLFTDWPISHSITDQHENPVSSLEVILGQKVSSYGRTQWTCRSNASVQPWPRRPFS